MDSFEGVLSCDPEQGTWSGSTCYEGSSGAQEIRGDVQQGFCSMSCLADMLPDTDERDIACGPRAFLYGDGGAEGPELSGCELRDSGWSVPQGEDVCYAVANGPEGAFDALPSACREQDGHTAFVVVGDTSAIGTEWTGLGVFCQFQIYRDDVCPGQELPDDNVCE